MKIYIIWTFLLINSSLFSQLTDTTCLKTRWISITSSERNEFLFTEDNENNFFIKILELAVNEKIDLYLISCNEEKYILPHIKFQKDTIHGNKGCCRNENRIELKISFDMLTNYLGEDSIIVNEKGEEELVFPPILHWNFDVNSINNIKIKEDNVYIKEIDKVDFTVSEIGFEINSFNSGSAIFWINM